MLIAIPVSIGKGLIMGIVEFYKMIVETLIKIIKRVKDFIWQKHHYRKGHK
jgi:hypothetical protein